MLEALVEGGMGRGGHTHHVDGVGFAGEAVGVVASYVGGTKDALDGALLDVELEVAEAFAAGDVSLGLEYSLELHYVRTKARHGELLERLTVPPARSSNR